MLKGILSQDEFRKKRYYLWYALFFLILSFLVFLPFLRGGYTHIWKPDGWSQHVKALAYYSRYLKDVFHGISQGSFSFPNWDYTLGEGADILQTLTHYGFGDPLYLISALIPEQSLSVFYDITVYIRLFLAGFFFPAFCIERGHKNSIALLCGSLSYVFCYWGLLNANRNPLALNPLLLLPLLLLGAERILQKKRPYILILAVMLSAVSATSFLLPLLLFTLLYILFRLFVVHRKSARTGAAALFQSLLSILIGLLMGAAILLPMAALFLQKEITPGNLAMGIFYPVNYYKKLPAVFVTPEFTYWLCLALPIPILFAVFSLFANRKENRPAKCFFLLGILAIVFPAAGYVLNHFSYATNLWCFGFAFLCTFILVLTWDHLTDLATRESKWLLFFYLIFVALSIAMKPSRLKGTLMALAMGIILLELLVLFKGMRRLLEWILLVFVIANLGINAHLIYDGNVEGKVSESVTRNEAAKGLEQNETAALLQYDESVRKGAVRMAGASLTENANTLAGISSTQFYWDEANLHILDFRQALGLSSQYQPFRFSGYDDRSELLSLSAVEYYVTKKEDQPAPFGFSFADSVTADQAVQIWQNENELPYAYAYRDSIARRKWEALPPGEKEAVMLKAAVVENGDTSFAGEEGSTLKIPYEVRFGEKGVEEAEEGTGFEVRNADKAEVILGLSGEGSGELLFEIKGLHSKTTTGTIHMTLTTDTGVEKTLYYHTPYYSWYDDRHDFVVNLGYMEELPKEIRITFSKKTNYLFEEMNLWLHSMEEYEGAVSKLRDRSPSVVELKQDEVSMEYTADEDEILCISVPYSEGWTAYDNGTAVPVEVVNLKNIGLRLGKGDHKISLVYQTPYRRMGLLLSLIGCALFGASILVTELARKLKSRKNSDIIKGQKDDRS